MPGETSTSMSSPQPGNENSPAPAAQAQTPGEKAVHRELYRKGFGQYADLLTSERIGGRMLGTLSNEELRRDLNVKVLRHRREILKAIAAEMEEEMGEEHHMTEVEMVRRVPEFGRILVHTSNVRTFHSWFASSGQIIMFAFAIVRLQPVVPGQGRIGGIAGAFVAAALVHQLYGVFRYWKVLQGIEEGSLRVFTADMIGVLGALLLSLAIGIVVLYLVAEGSFD